MMMTTRWLSIFMLCVICPYTGMAQVWDFHTWHRFKAGGLLTKKLSLSVEQQLRLYDNSSKVDETFTEFGLKYNLPKGFEVAAAYRLAWSNSNGVISDSHRYNFDVAYGRNFWNLKADLRARFQHRPSPSYFNERLELRESPVFVRLKFSLTYEKLKKWKPGVEYEVFFRVASNEEKGANRFRYRVFVERDLPKRQAIGVFYMLQTDNSGRTPEFTSIVGVNYSYEWKRPKKKKEKEE